MQWAGGVGSYTLVGRGRRQGRERLLGSVSGRLGNGTVYVLQPGRFVHAVGGEGQRREVLTGEVSERGVFAGAYHFADRGGFEDVAPILCKDSMGK